MCDILHMYTMGLEEVDRALEQDPVSEAEEARRRTAGPTNQEIFNLEYNEETVLYEEGQGEQEY